MAEQLTPEQAAALQEKLKQMSPEQIQELVKKQCVFCRIVAGEIPSKKVYEDDNFLAFLDINPANIGHVLVVTKDHFSVLPQLPNELAAKYFVLVKELSARIYDALGAQGINILQNNGPAAGQEVPHIHIHIIPRFEEDGVRFTWEPKKAEESEVDAVLNKIKAKAKDIDIKGVSVSKKKEVIEMTEEREQFDSKGAAPSPARRIP